MKSFRMFLAMSLTIVSSAIPALADSQVTSSSQETSLSSGSFLLQAVGLLVIVACVLVSFKFYMSIKGGRVGQGWMWVFCGLLVFAGAQLLLLGGQLGVVPLLVIWVDALKVVSLLLFFVGINQLRKIMA
jgi:hypothetical protein